MLVGQLPVTLLGTGPLDLCPQPLELAPVTVVTVADRQDLGAFAGRGSSLLGPTEPFLERLLVAPNLAQQCGVGVDEEEKTVEAKLACADFELLRSLQEWRMTLFGSLLVVMMIVRPWGLVGQRRPRLP